MKKRFVCFLLLLLLALLLPAAAFAQEAEPAPTEEVIPTSFPYVLDQAGLLRDSQRGSLEQRAKELSELHQFSLYVIILKNYKEFSGNIVSCVQGIQDFYDLGWNGSDECAILLVSMADRDYDLEGFGTLGNQICDFESSWIIEDAFLDDLRQDDWYGAFSDYLDACDSQLTKLENGEDLSAGADIITGPDGLDYHEYNNPYASRGMPAGMKLAIVVLLPLLIAGITVGVFRAQMRTAREKTTAEEYLVPRSMDLRVREDRFTHRTVTRTRIDSDSGSRGGGGGGSSFHSGGGSSGRSGKF